MTTRIKHHGATLPLIRSLHVTVACHPTAASFLRSIIHDCIHSPFFFFSFNISWFDSNNCTVIDKRCFL
jgi:hypothetical protein